MKWLIAFWLISCTAHAQDFRSHIVYLTSEPLAGRAPATTGERQAARYVSDQLSGAGCSVRHQCFRFGVDSAVNVLGALDFGKDSTILISAHYDHLGTNSSKSREVKKYEGFHPGADDNASGVAMLLELARYVSSVSGWRYNFLFAAYSAHEEGLVGSSHFASSTYCDSLRIRAVLNFDMVGRMDVKTHMIRVSGAKSDAVFQQFFTATQSSEIAFRFDDSNIMLSDLKPFAERQLPVLNITTGTHDDYHRLSDTEEKINYGGMTSIFNLMKSLLNAVAR